MLLAVPEMVYYRESMLTNFSMYKKIVITWITQDFFFSLLYFKYRQKCVMSLQVALIAADTLLKISFQIVYVYLDQFKKRVGILIQKPIELSIELASYTKNGR